MGHVLTEMIWKGSMLIEREQTEREKLKKGRREGK